MGPRGHAPVASPAHAGFLPAFPASPLQTPRSLSSSAWPRRGGTPRRSAGRRAPLSSPLCMVSLSPAAVKATCLLAPSRAGPLAGTAPLSATSGHLNPHVGKLRQWRCFLTGFREPRGEADVGPDDGRRAALRRAGLPARRPVAKPCPTALRGPRELKSLTRVVDFLSARLVARDLKWRLEGCCSFFPIVHDIESRVVGKMGDRHTPLTRRDGPLRDRGGTGRRVCPAWV